VLLTLGLTAAYFHEQLAGLWAWEVSPDVLLLYAAMAVTLIALCFYTASCVKQLRIKNTEKVENGNETKGN
jgi:hypothetical protein